VFLDYDIKVGWGRGWERGGDGWGGGGMLDSVSASLVNLRENLMPMFWGENKNQVKEFWVVTLYSVSEDVAASILR
jgi:hypothetical protein